MGRMHLIAALSALAVASACAEKGPLSGALAFNPKTQAFGPIGASDIVLKGINIVLASDGSACALVDAGTAQPQVLIIEFLGDAKSDSPVPTGTFPLVTGGSACVNCALLYLSQDGWHSQTGFQAVSGTLTLTSLTSTEALGSFSAEMQELNNPDGGITSLSGKFDAPFCSPH
jgi:hypothetical protein